MPVLTRAALKTKLDLIIRTNGNKEITAADENSLLTDFIDSFFNAVDSLGMVGLSEFDPSRSYPGGSCCVTHGIVYQALVNVSPGSFDNSQWSPLLFGSGVIYSIATRKEALAPITGGVGNGVEDTFTLEAGRLGRDGDKIRITAMLGVIGGDSANPAIILDFHTSLGVVGVNVPPMKINQIAHCVFEITRETNAIIRISYSICCNYDPGAATNVYDFNGTAVMGGRDLDSSNYDIRLHFEEWSGGAETGLSIEELNVELAKKLF